jgi:large subunit ribosomal protein L16
MAGVEETLARAALTLAIHKMPFKCKIITLKDSNELY